MATSDGDKYVMSELLKIPLFPTFNRRVQELFFCYTEAYKNPWLKWRENVWSKLSILNKIEIIFLKLVRVSALLGLDLKFLNSKLQ